MTIRRAGPEDAVALAEAHRDSIRAVGGRYYPAEIVRDWEAHLAPDLYQRAMAAGEVFFVAVGGEQGGRAILGFSSHRVEEHEHRTAVYVRGSAARRGIGSALFREAEAVAIAAGAGRLHVAASLAAVEFYASHGFVEVGRGEHHLRTGRAMACVFMEKVLPAAP